MTLVKIGVVGDGNGAVSVYRSGEIPTFDDRITVDGEQYQVTDVRRFTSVKREDAVRVDVRPITDTSDEGRKLIV